MIEHGFCHKKLFMKEMDAIVVTAMFDFERIKYELEKVFRWRKFFDVEGE